MAGLQFRFFWPLALITACLVSLCVVVAVSLFRQQATLAGVFQENVASRRAAVELEECLTDLIALEKAHVESVSVLHARVQTHLATIKQVADQPEEKELYAKIAEAFAEYLRRWQAMPPLGDPNHDVAFRDATRFLESEVLRPCTEFRLFNGWQLELATEDHERVLRRLAWGMAGIGGLGGFAGVVLGFGVARGLSRSIRRLQVQIRDAAGKLTPHLPEIVVTGEGDFRGLHEQVDHLSARIESVVQELQQREHEVLRAEQLAAVGQLAAGVGHEIRNPLTAIKMLVQSALEAQSQSGLTGEDLRIIEGEIRRMERSLQTFLEFARPPKPERQVLELQTIIGAVLGLVRGRIEKQRVSTQVDAPETPVTLTADPGQLQQVFLNLVMNALDAMPGAGTLAIIVRPGKDRVVVEVSDTGPGVPRDVMPRLFQPFVSGKDTGLGLGLVISERIVNDHAGTIGAGNRPGGGASFFVMLPTGDTTER
ncbi:MAG: ATP-binding protein [Planctomycetia bacterium]|nr:ATP-binding protein [Planctomycetia bacterium]